VILYCAIARFAIAAGNNPLVRVTRPLVQRSFVNRMVPSPNLFAEIGCRDADGNGVINFDDYARIDNSFNNRLIGYSNGDFNYNGVINFDDYALIDLAFNTQ
jgi:hypothetical protein